MDFTQILNWLMGVTDWVEEVIINGLLGQGFEVLIKVLFAIVSLKPLIDLLGLLSGVG